MESDLPPWVWPRAAYVHVPFCAHHCGYCDFAVATGQDHAIDRYIQALGMELAHLGQPQPVETLFLGGGTPTHLDGRQLQNLLELVLRWLPLAADHEFSVEANPGTLTADKIAILADHGVNRISLGAQSFHPHLLVVLERDHQPDDVPRAMERIRKRISNVSLDLIFGVPGQSLVEWETDLDRALSLRPTHLSTYGLTYEKGTRLWKQQRQGEVQALDEEAELAMYLFAMDRLEEAGFEHYEISSFALPGFRCRHNQVYWANEAYFGLGMGAAAYVRGRRTLNTRDLQTYLHRVLAGESCVFQEEELPPEERARETMLLNLRRADGIDRPAFRNQTAFEVDELAGPALTNQIDLGLLEDDGKRIRLTRSGKCVADAVIAQLVKELSSVP
ncbi:MAG TPA: radical SAM family heme chaperone HemW [Gemmataceae bacterium]|nr:radical SAM family heme chaperone HemW [Gemmataceae bacterium]